MNKTNNSFKNISFSKLAIFTIILISVLYTFQFKQWKTSRGVIQIDIMGYYAYLPATFIYNDIHFDFLDNPENSHLKDKVLIRKGRENYRIIQYTSGLSICYLPGFLCAHYIIAPLLNYPTDGYSFPYEICLQFIPYIYFFLGLLFLRKTLLKFFSDQSTALTLIIITLGTNLMFYISKQAPMSHIFSFSLIAIFQYFIFRWNDEKNLRTTILLGFLTGLILLIRPVNVFIVLLFFLLGVSNLTELKNRIIELIKSWHLILLMIFFAFLVWVPQMLYWHEITGRWFTNSYGDRVAFFWGEPKILKLLFSYRKGWLLYTPIMIFTFFGLPFLWKQNKQLFFSSCGILAISIYVLSCWCYWWYGGGYGIRSFIDFYSIFAIPIAAITQMVISHRKMKHAYILLLSIFVLHNNFQIIQYKNGAIHYNSMTKEAYWDSFGRIHPSQNFNSILKPPDYSGTQERIKAKHSK